ncbi:type IV pilus modification PilV family protein [Aneurinibacillus migulanus]|uniref:Prepilin-type N-terminal cleavage/methylation domain-containing protein n=1 Tax=Aneurinibacillus migulanus TaxID=47500 RepID=A0A0D1V638_ANEMI|nr:hypothetical protein [Aneurinibacillus migulanus]KIV54839.1 hypothetical protein TS65_18450 [Aneurinibacillus migulanus]KON95526.1 hypothetical protein AF333_08600 [Aneurinibacillus migulanus]MED0892099.1 hypothetical protein [Aneurinibacillus migulanus]MED1618708.1 hypothetical protein [Aneurinibacillus migulanus]SDJ07244.1 hypothetical protein SAMN04487909_111102 [Aneurinibacillus migulanus]
MKEDGFTYIEALLSLALFAIFVLAVQQVLHVSVRERAERSTEATAYLLAYSLLEQWKAGLVVETDDREIEGKRYRIQITSTNVTEMVERCEVQVFWESEWVGERRIGFLGYRFMPLVRSAIIEE